MDLPEDFPFVNDSQATLYKRFVQFQKRLTAHEDGAESCRVQMGYVLINIAHRFYSMPLKPNRPFSYDRSEDWVAFKRWCEQNTGLQWVTCRNYMDYAMKPEVYQKQVESQRVSSQLSRDESRAFREMSGGRGLPKDQQRMNFAVNSLNILDLESVWRAVELTLSQRQDWNMTEEQDHATSAIVRAWRAASDLATEAAE